MTDTVDDCYMLQVELCQNISRSRNPSRDQLEDSSNGIGGGGGGDGGEVGEGNQDSTKHSAISGDAGQVLLNIILDPWCWEAVNRY